VIGNNAEVEVDVEIEVEAVALPDNATLSRRRRLVAPGAARTCNLQPATRRKSELAQSSCRN
jgi:hypothetical protein